MRQGGAVPPLASRRRRRRLLPLVHTSDQGPVLSRTGTEDPALFRSVVQHSLAGLVGCCW